MSSEKPAAAHQERSALNTNDAHSGKMIISAAAAGAGAGGASASASASADVVLQQALDDAHCPMIDIGHVPLERAERMAGQGQAVDLGGEEQRTQVTRAFQDRPPSSGRGGSQGAGGGRSCRCCCGAGGVHCLTGACCVL